MKKITLPDSLSSPFIEWLDRGGHGIKVKRNRVTATKGDKVGIIYCENGKTQSHYNMNEYLVERYQVFLKQWLNHDKQFILNLRSAMVGRYLACQHQHNLLKMAKVA
ncbi:MULTISPECIES: hypothetical protein [unclassified Acinetobacter]|uniref:hypothetical protein n=1 Tax=unclassified Acinetobacter TaxID=196816 RepID=UPI0029342744|nr:MULTISPECIES: hypothetical protein [unclassified Acinetobacter]WOE32786.1 hypothetical protein QSG84_06320 [Acinetobacter sp. SAAs470]WOE38263.1 hypothetical protein QSG86_15375 [Acinetobacter sp. SAAs474]